MSPQIQRTQAALPQDVGAQERPWLVFRLGPYVMCASALDVEGIIEQPKPVTKFPVMPDYALGAFLFRGRSATAISLRRKLKLRQGEDSATGPFIAARIRDAVVAFWVDEVKDVIEEKDADWRPLPEMLEGGLFERFAIREGELILQTSFAALLEAEIEFESFAVWAAAHPDAGLAPAASSPERAPVAEAAAGAKPAFASPDAKAEGEAPGATAADAARRSGEVRETAPSPVGEAPGQPSPAAESRESEAAGAEARVQGSTDSGPRGTASRLGGGDARAPSQRRTAATFRVRPPPFGTGATSPVPLRDSARTAATTRGDAIEDSSAAASEPFLDAREKPSSRRYGFVSAAIAFAVVAVILYGLLPESPDLTPPAPASSAPAATSPGPGSPSVPAQPEAQQAAKRIVSIESDALTLTVERPAEKTAAAATPAAETPGVAGARVHIVVRGDTLWDIAKKHVGDPFRYPELAQFSNIRNPDLIYPGDIVRIEIRERR